MQKNNLALGKMQRPKGLMSELSMYSLLGMRFAISQIQDGRHERYLKFYKNGHFLTLFAYLWEPQDQEIWKLVLGTLKWYSYATFYRVLWNLTKSSMTEGGHFFNFGDFWVQDEKCKNLTLHWPKCSAQRVWCEMRNALTDRKVE